MKFVKDQTGILFVVSAPSGAGKTSLCQEVVKRMPNVEHGISYTTRRRRPTEVDGEDYYFVSKEKFMEMVEADEFVEYAFVHGNYYGTSITSIAKSLARGKNLIIDIDVQGAMQIQDRYGDQGIFIFILPPDFEMLRNRLSIRRSETEEEIDHRLKKAEEEVQHYEYYDYVIINDDFKQAVKELEAIILAEQCHPRRVYIKANGEEVVEEERRDVE